MRTVSDEWNFRRPAATTVAVAATSQANASTPTSPLEAEPVYNFSMHAMDLFGEDWRGGGLLTITAHVGRSRILVDDFSGFEDFLDGSAGATWIDVSEHVRLPRVQRRRTAPNLRRRERSRGGRRPASPPPRQGSHGAPPASPRAPPEPSSLHWRCPSN